MKLYATKVDFSTNDNTASEVNIVINWNSISKMEPDFLEPFGPIMRVSYLDTDYHRVIYIKVNGMEVK